MEYKTIDDIDIEDLIIERYNPYPKIQVKNVSIINLFVLKQQ